MSIDDVVAVGNVAGMDASPALLAVSHGTDSAAGQAAVAALVAAVAAQLPDVTVRLGHVDVQQPDVEASFAALPDDKPVVIVPLLLSAGYHVHVDLARAARRRHNATVAPALGPDARLAEVLADRLGESGAARDDTVVLAVAGSSDERANDDCRHTASMLAQRLERDVRVGFLAAAQPRLVEAVAMGAASGHRVAVATYLLAPGYFHDLTVRTAGEGCLVTPPLLTVDAPPQALIDIVIDRYRAGLAGG